MSTLEPTTIETQASNRKVLLVEDDAIVQRVHKAILTRLGYEVVLAETAAEALAKSREGEYALILMDMGLPDGEGTEVIQAIRQDEKAKQTRTSIIVLTGYAQDEAYDKCMAVDADDFHTKPVSFVKIEELLNKWAK